MVPSISATIKKLKTIKRFEEGESDKYVKTFLCILRSKISRKIDGIILSPDTNKTILG
jgi:hypothetical protein